MRKKILYTTCFFVFILGLSFEAFAQMGSESYSIPTSVLSGGGGPMSSENYETNTTLGQTSPIMDPADPPYSDNYDLYPGFWYTLEAGITGCENLSSFATAYGALSTDLNYNSLCDFNVDGDIDGSDLSDFIAGYGL
jgi:hypothetical protein